VLDRASPGPGGTRPPSSGVVDPLRVMTRPAIRTILQMQQDRRPGGTVTTTDPNDVEELGPVDYIVVEFPGSKFNGEIAPALKDLVDRGIIRVLDIVILQKDDKGTLEVAELSDLDESEVGSIRDYETELAMLLSEDDVIAVAEAIEPGTTAAVLVWENKWAVPFATAVRHSGGLLVASGRIPIQAIAAAIEADDEDEGD
jgi:hypothetical protein